MKSYQEYVAALLSAYRSADAIPLANAPARPQPKVIEEAGTALIFSPHPDDEAIVAGLPLRLQRECGMRIVNLAVTLGSNKARQQERIEEVKSCCAYLGFDLMVADECGLEDIHLLTRRHEPTHWIHAADVLGLTIRQIAPRLIIYPHSGDGHRTHIGVNALVNHALLRLGKDFSCFCLETEFWSPMETPNLMVESTPEDVAAIISGLSYHQGEIRRNPFHLRLPAWMMDNVRRGAEIVGDKGSEAPPFDFATLYRLRFRSEGRFHECLPMGWYLSKSDDAGLVFKQNQA